MFELASGVLGLIGNVGKMFSRGKANREMGKLLEQDPTYKANPIADQRLGLARTLLNARMPGAAAAERNIYTNQANATSGATRAATDASQLLAEAGQIQGNTNDAFNRLGISEAEDYQRRYGNVVGAEDAVIQEGDKVFNDQVRRFGDRAQIKGGQVANNAANWADLGNMGFSLMDFGASGGFGNFKDLFGKKPSGVGRNLGGMFGRMAGG